MVMEETIIIDFELKEDLVESYSKNPDIQFNNLNIKTSVEALPVGTLLEVEKKIGSPIIILSAKEIKPETLSSAFL